MKQYVVECSHIQQIVDLRLKEGVADVVKSLDKMFLKEDE
jgi:hypothetical protein